MEVLPRLRKAIAALEVYIATLSPAEKKAADVVDFDIRAYEEQSLSLATLETCDKTALDLSSEKHCLEMIEGIKEDVAKFHQKEAGQDPNSRILKGLTRYLALPRLWRQYLCARFDPNYLDTDKTVSLVDDKGDRWIFALFGAMANELDMPNVVVERTQFEQITSRFEAMLKEVEAVQPSEPFFLVIPSELSTKKDKKFWGDDNKTENKNKKKNKKKDKKKNEKNKKKDKKKNENKKKNKK